MADLANAQGTEILSSKYFCMEEGQAQTTHQWPLQPRPGPKHRAKWQQFLDKYCHTPSLHLIQPLGGWIQHPQRTWEGYYDPTLKTICIKSEMQWSHYGIILKMRRYWKIPKNQVLVDFTPPSELDHLQPVDIIRKHPQYY